MNIRKEDLGDGVAHLVFDKPDSGANTFDLATMAELEQHLTEIAADASVTGLVISSAKPSIFIAGADIKELFDESMTDHDVRTAVESGQRVFSSLEALSIPTVAAIHGAAVGGGCEIALACDYRVASDDRATKIGLPETQLGILPAWGGSTRLPRLIGLAAALDIILGAKQLAAGKARKVGLVDDVVPGESLIGFARSRLSRGKAKPRSFGLKHSAPVRAIVASVARRNAMAKTRGHYPAVPLALDVVVDGLGTTKEVSFRNEATAIMRLARTDVCRNLVRVYWLQDRSKNFKVDLPEGMEPDKRRIQQVNVIGAGVMGAGIAQWCSARGQEVILKDISEDQLARGMAGMAKVYQQAARRRIFTRAQARDGMDRVYPTVEDVPMGRVDLVIEAAVERMDIKKTLFQGLAEAVREDTILASNTSALSISELAEGLPHPGRVIGIHYFNPVHRMQLVEVVVGEQTDPRVTGRVVAFVQKSGKLPVVVKDSPGFVVNRVLMPYLVESGFLASNGASFEAIDNAMLDFGMPMGPIRLTDEVGVDVCSHVVDHLADKLGDRMVKPAVLSTLIDKGWLGRKADRGFYVYGGKGKPRVNADLTGLVASRSHADVSTEELQRRMVLLMVNEAARCIEEDLVAGPEDIDFAMIFGTGFAPFRGGPLRYADSYGIARVVEELRALQGRDGDRFVPCALLETMATESRTFYS